MKAGKSRGEISGDQFEETRKNGKKKKQVKWYEIQNAYFENNPIIDLICLFFSIVFYGLVYTDACFGKTQLSHVNTLSQV